MYSEEELPVEFKLFVPQSQKSKKINGTIPSLNKQTKENVGPSNEEASLNPNKSELPEESQNNEVRHEEEYHEEGDEEGEKVDRSVNVN